MGVEAHSTERRVYSDWELLVLLRVLLAVLRPPQDWPSWFDIEEGVASEMEYP
jgi:hypothetical protein